MHPLAGAKTPRPAPPEKTPALSCNTERPPADLPVKAPTPPAGGWFAWYLTDEDDVGESTEHGITIRLLLAALSELARERDWTDRLVAGDQFFGWVRTHPLVRISPDVYILDDPPPAPYPKSFQTWREGHAAPRFAVEVVSDEWQKDYDDNPPKYDQLGTRELVLYDPDAVANPRGRRVPLQVFRRDARGDLVLAESGPGPVRSAELDAWLVVVPGARLRIARDPAGTDLVRTADEQVRGLETQVDDLKAEIRDLKAIVRDQKATIRDQAAQLEAQKDRIREQDDRIREQDDRIREQDAVIQAQNAVIQAQNDRIREQDAVIQAQSDRIREQDAVIRDLRATVQAQDARLQAQDARLQAQDAVIRDLIAMVQAQADRIRDLEARLAARGE